MGIFHSIRTAILSSYFLIVMVALAVFALVALHYTEKTVLASVMYYTGLDPRTMDRVYVPTDPHEKAMQRALIQYRNPKN